jgi:hypothetical protein
MRRTDIDAVREAAPSWEWHVGFSQAIGLHKMSHHAVIARHDGQWLLTVYINNPCELALQVSGPCPTELAAQAERLLHTPKGEANVEPR